MKKVFLVEMSTDEMDNELLINRFIYDIGRRNTVTWLTNLIHPLNADKYMLVAEVDKVTSDTVLTPEIGVKIVRGSQDMSETEDILNEALDELKMSDRTFLSISNPIEYMYILLYENASTDLHTHVHVLPKPVDCYSGSRYLSNRLQHIEKDNDGELQPYDIVMLKEHMLMLYSD